MHRNYHERGGSEAFQNIVEKPKPPEKLNKLIKEISLTLNKEAYDKHGLNGLVDHEGQIKPQGYSKIYSKDELAYFQNEVHKRELEFSDAEHPNIQRYYKETYGIEGENNIISQWKKEKKENKNTQMELAVTALLHKILQDRYFVVRTSEYDDYHNGIDNLIVDKETGVVICAFDEVHEGGTGERTNDKQGKIEKIATKGGAKIMFGLNMANGKLQRTALENLPVFYLGLTTKELQDLIENMDSENIDQLSEQEKTTYIKLISSVGEQMEVMQKKNLPTEVKNNLEKFQESFEALTNYPK
jgi:hypothetical protein